MTCRTRSTCCALMASCTCWGMTTRIPMSTRRCLACRTGCWRRGARSRAPALTWTAAPPLALVLLAVVMAAVPRIAGKGPGELLVGWLFVAALALTLLAGWCASAETALLRVSRAGAKELGRSAGEPSTPLQAVLAEVPRYLTVLLLARAAAEISATVLMTVVL